VGLLDYPVLMASDILLYKIDFVPVGDDQKQHLELTRDIAKRFNAIYGETFRLPEPLISGVGGRIMGLDEPQKKMSKSDTKKAHAIYLLDSADDIRLKISRAVTDSHREICFDVNRFGIYNLLLIYELFTGLSRSIIEEQYKGKDYVEFKRDLSEVIIENLRPIQRRYTEFSADLSYIETLLAESASKIRPIANETLIDVKNIIGLG
jgi:tryptophanyl-tRNA synthetase